MFNNNIRSREVLAFQFYQFIFMITTALSFVRVPIASSSYTMTAGRSLNKQ